MTGYFMVQSLLLAVAVTCLALSQNAITIGSSVFVAALWVLALVRMARS